jgi:peroxiredoxin
MVMAVPLRSITPQRIADGDTFAAHELTTIQGDTVRIPDPDHLVHLQYRRFAGCPICSLHLRSMVTRNDEIVDAGIKEVVVFHSSADDLRRYADDLPFAVVGDPERELYREFGVETAARSLLHPGAWGPELRALGKAVAGIARRRQPAPPLVMQGGPLGLPADVLVAGDGRVLASKYGVHAYDQWSVDELLELARRST